MSDWRFFDHHHSGAEILRSERQPIINHIKQKLHQHNNITQPDTTSPNPFDDDEPFKQCQNCGGYIQDAVGPGIMTERQLLKSKTDHHELSLQVKLSHNTLTMSPPGSKSPIPGLRDFKLTPAHTNRFLAQYSLSPRVGHSNLPSQVFELSRKMEDNQRRRTPSFYGKRNVEDRKKEPLFTGYHVMLLRRFAKVFIHFNGIKASLTMGATSFRNMARR